MRLSNQGSLGVGTTSPTARVHSRATSTVAGLFERTATSGVVPTVRATSASPDAPAVLAQNSATGVFKGLAVRGFAASGTPTRLHSGGAFWEAAGEFCGLNGVIGAAGPEVQDGYGVIGLADNSIGVGVYARGTGGANAIVADGDVEVAGTLTKSGGSFKIDHPLDPANKYLSHSFVESPDMMNVYNGVVTADSAGRAVVTLPDWFEALNRDFRYQLTAIGGPAPNLHVGVEVHRGRFTIGGATPGHKVSWQVTGIRQDAWAQAHRIPVSQAKPAAERGRYLHPELYGAPPDAQVGFRQASL